MFNINFTIDMPTELMTKKVLENKKKEIRPVIENALFEATQVIKQNYPIKVKSAFGEKRGNNFIKMVNLPTRENIKPISSTKDIDTYLISPNVSSQKAGLGSEWEGIWHMHEFGETNWL